MPDGKIAIQLAFLDDTGGAANTRQVETGRLHLIPGHDMQSVWDEPLPPCSTDQHRTINIIATIGRADGYPPTLVDVLRAVTELDFAPGVLCAHCFSTSPWSVYAADATARAITDRGSRPITTDLTTDQAVVIAYLVASTEDQNTPVPENTPQFCSTLTTVELSPAAHAVVAGFVAPDEDADTRHGVNIEGIMAHPSVWAELRTTFPLTLYHAWAKAYPDQHPPDSTLVRPLRALFPLSTFWGYAATGTEDDPNYLPDAGY
jgi:hypothetical protein